MMDGFCQIDEPQEGDRIVLCLGKELTDEQYERVLQSVIAFITPVGRIRKRLVKPQIKITHLDAI